MNIINRFTLQTLKKNKVRTAVTIIGILLSTAMFTAVTSIIISLQQYMINVEISVDGAWQGRLNNLSELQAQKLLGKEEVTESTLVKNVGYAKLKDSANEDKPYLCIESITSDFTKQSPITLTEGRMPENEEELVLSRHLSENGNINYEVGDTLQVEVGIRDAGEGFILGQHVQYTENEEKLSNTTTKKYQVVGICERPALENYSAPGYTAFTTDEKQQAYSYDVLFQVRYPENIDKFINQFLKENVTASEDGIYDIHSSLLRDMGRSPQSNYMQTLWNMGIILIVIIMAASISLIYNAFSISISERTKQFGLLKSIGATKKQIRKSVLFEAFSLCLIGIPLGIISGLFGIGITLHFIGRLLVDLVPESYSSAQLELIISWQAILPAAIIAFVTITISAMLPARRAVKMPAIYALRENNEIKIRKSNVRSSKLVYKLFGFEGMLANKNLKRNRRKHRLTVASLALSVILFISTNGFTNYMTSSTDIIDVNTIHDISFWAEQEELGKNDPSQTKLRLKQVKYVDEVAYSAELDGYSKVPMNSVSTEYQKWIKTYLPNMMDSAGKNALLGTHFVFIDNNTYKKYLEKHGLDLNRYLNRDNPAPLIWDQVNMMAESGKVIATNLLSGKGFLGSAYYINSIKDYQHTGEITDPEKLTLSYAKTNSNNEMTEISDSDIVSFPKEKALTEVPAKDAKIMNEKLPLGGLDNKWNQNLTMVFPYSVYETFAKKTLEPASFYFMLQAKQHAQATEAVTTFFKNTPDYKTSIIGRIFDVRSSDESERSLLLIIKIFTYGFISLITLIVVANVFNTISTNIQLRRKEYAMLKSVGMTRKGFDRMMNYECILYGLKGLLFGLPVSFLLCFLMYRSMLGMWNAPFVLPWASIIIVCICVFVIVFASMLYSMSKIKKDNPIDALRNDNW